MARARKRPIPAPLRSGALGRPPGSSSEATSARILAAARACFARTGYAATTNKQIADEAGVTTAALYLYFESKTALYLATMRHAYAELVPQYRAAVAGARSVRDGFRALLAASARLHAKDPSLAAFFSALPLEMRRHAELMRATTDAGNEVVLIFSDVVATGVRAGEIPAATAPSVLSLFIACAMGFSLFAATIDSSQMGGITDAFSALIDGRLFRARRRGRAASAARRKR